MTPREVHIAIDLGLQKAGSFAYDNIKPEFIDMVFNRMGDAYITEKTTKPLDPKQLGFEDTQARLATIKELVTESTLSTYILSANETLFSLVPHNFFSFIEAKGSIIYSCSNSAVEYSSIPGYVNKATVPFLSDSFNTDAIFDEFKLYKVVNNIPTEIFNFLDNYSADTTTDLDEIFFAKNKAIEEVNRGTSGIKLYWESYDGTFATNSFIAVAGSDYNGQKIRIQYHAGTPPFIPASTSTISFTSTEYLTPVIDNNASYSRIKSSYCRLLSNEETYHMLAHPFGTTSFDSPIINIVGDRIISYVNERFILKGLTLKYIRKPRKMSLSLNQSYELQDSRAIAKIIDMTVEYLSATIESQGLQALTIQNQQRD